ncbi:peptidylprolyl isomerase [Candidatus Woesearchaeota archaeon]|nr:peptidylprolyl isomerase [Candidatus Woesearchaeota archaeon]
MTDKIKNGDKVKIEYTGKLEDGTVFDTSEGKAPLTFEVGAKQVIPGFEKAVEGMTKGEEKTFKLSVEDSYGPTRKELVQEIPRDKLPDKPEPQEGMMLMMKAPTGQQIPARITKVTDDKVTIDINHPLAGKELEFTVKIVGVNEPEDEKDKQESQKEDGEGKDDSECSDCSECPGCK